MNVGLILPAAGKGLRFGGSLPKQYQLLCGEPIIVHTLRTCLRVPMVTAIVVALHPDDALFSRALEEAGIHDPRIVVVEGDAERQLSIQTALAHTSLDSTDIVVVHDAVRPLASGSLFERVITTAAQTGAAIPVVAVTDTVKRVDSNGCVVETVSRADLRLVQTPQAFSTTILRDAYNTAMGTEFLGTDDASVVEHDGVVVHTVDGEPWNVKVTTVSDLASAEVFMSRRSYE
ncbi:MAG: 2-C-methyl-D-erythritol 4-phosphate cytidylyltransferase [Candidatus Kapaibacteriota bacterium]